MLSGIDWFLDSSVLLRLVFSVVLGGLIGWERELHGRPAGIRTHMIVCLGATMLILSSEMSHVHSGDALFDLDRMAAGIIMGIGFLGAGAIMRDGNLVRGLTTAGCIWFVAGLGIVIGQRSYSLAIWATIIALSMLVFLKYVESRLSATRYQDLVVRVASQDYKVIREKCAELFREKEIAVTASKFTFDNGRGDVEVRLSLQLKRGKLDEDLIFEVSRLPGVLEARF